MLCLAGVPAWAQSVAQGAAREVALDLPAQPLAEALAEFGRQTGVRVTAAPELVAGKAAPAVRARLTLAEGAQRLLAGSGLEAVAQGDALLIRRVGSATSNVNPGSTAGAVATGASLEEVRVVAGSSFDETPKTFAGGQVAQGSRIGILGNSDVFSTPFSTTAYTAELIRNQGARNADEVLANDPSVRTSASPTHVLDQSTIRGFLVTSGNYLFDGVPGMVNHYGAMPIHHFERVEVLKGPNSGVAATVGAVGGVVNMVPKRATDEDVTEITTGWQSASLKSAAVDIGRRFGVDRSLGLRLNVSGEAGQLYDGNERHQMVESIAFDWRGSNVRFMLDAGQLNYRNDSTGMNLSLRAGAAVPPLPDPHVNPYPRWGFTNNDTHYALGTLEVDLNNAWTLYARAGTNHQYVRRVNVDYSALNSLGIFSVNGYSYGPWRNDKDTQDAGVKGTFMTGPVRHQVVLSGTRFDGGVSYFGGASVTRAQPAGSIYGLYPLANPYAWGLPPDRLAAETLNSQKSYAAADTLTALDERLVVMLAARHQHIRSGAYDQTKTTPTGAILYKITPDVSLYANYAEALTQGAVAPTNAANRNEQLPPYLGKQKEVGAKWNLGNFGLTAAYFEIVQASAYLDSDNVFRAAGQQKNKGLELETFGEPLKGLRLLGGVSWIDGRMTQTAGGTYNGNKALGVPKLNVNLGAEVDIPGVPGLTLTGRVMHTGSSYIDLANTQRLSPWNRLDLGVRYATKLASGQDLMLRAGVTNATDKRYWASAGRNFFFVGAPRQYGVSATVSF